MHFNGVTEFKYLRSMITYDNIKKVEIKARLTAGNRCNFSLRNSLKSCLISRIITLKICKIVIKPTVIYGSDTWTTTQKRQKVTY